VESIKEENCGAKIKAKLDTKMEAKIGVISGSK